MESLNADQPFPTTDEDAIKYIPDDPSAHGIYRCHRAMGDSIAQAMIVTLDACLSVPASEETQEA